MSIEDLKNYFNHPLTAKEQYDYWQESANDLEAAKPIDDEERQMIKEWRSLKVEDFKDETEEDFKKRVKEEIKIKKTAFVELEQKKPMTMNININTIDKLKQKANEAGMNYQTLINVILKQYVDGKISVAL